MRPSEKWPHNNGAKNSDSRGQGQNASLIRRSTSSRGASGATTAIYGTRRSTSITSTRRSENGVGQVDSECRQAAYAGHIPSDRSKPARRPSCLRTLLVFLRTAHSRTLRRYRSPVSPGEPHAFHTRSDAGRVSRTCAYHAIAAGIGSSTNQGARVATLTKTPDAGFFFDTRMSHRLPQRHRPPERRSGSMLSTHTWTWCSPRARGWAGRRRPVHHRGDRVPRVRGDGPSSTMTGRTQGRHVHPNLQSAPKQGHTAPAVHDDRIPWPPSPEYAP